MELRESALESSRLWVEEVGIREAAAGASKSHGTIVAPNYSHLAAAGQVAVDIWTQSSNRETHSSYYLAQHIFVCPTVQSSVSNKFC